MAIKYDFNNLNSSNNDLNEVFSKFFKSYKECTLDEVLINFTVAYTKSNDEDRILLGSKFASVLNNDKVNQIFHKYFLEAIEKSFDEIMGDDKDKITRIKDWTYHD